MRFRDKNSGLTIGITGVIGSGKSLACAYLMEKHGFHWISADMIVHRLYKKGEKGYVFIKEKIGKHFVTDKEVDRTRLRDFVLIHPQFLDILNKGIHPFVRDSICDELKKMSDKKICIEALYFDKDVLGKFADVIIQIDAPDSVIYKRVAARGISKNAITALLAFQRNRISSNFLVIMNNGTIECFYKRLDTLIHEYGFRNSNRT